VEKLIMRLADLNWMDVESYLKSDDRLMLVLGACEQHGYLSLLTDVKIPLALADAASQQTGVPVAPPLNFGASPYFLAYPGTLSLRVSTLLDVVEDLVRSLYRQGFRRMLLLNGHGGNDPVRARLYELADELADLRLSWYAWWRSPSVTATAQQHGLESSHGGWIEAFDFTRVADLPAGEKKPPAMLGLVSAEQARQAYGDGMFGGPYAVDREIMDEIFAVALDDVIRLLEFGEEA
jgi:creatinine amidohydrolase